MHVCGANGLSEGEDGSEGSHDSTETPLCKSQAQREHTAPQICSQSTISSMMAEANNSTFVEELNKIEG